MSELLFQNQDPLSTINGDLLSRKQLVAQAVKLVEQARKNAPHTSSVIGVTGSWGSGKTSLMNFVASELQGQQIDQWDVLRFTPWSALDPESLLAEFYAVIQSGLGLEKSPNFRRLAGRTLKAGTKAVSLLVNSSDSGQVLQAPVELLKHLAVDSTEEYASKLLQSEPWEVLFNKVCDEISTGKGAPRKVLVIADDIDRLQSDELIIFLKTLRLLGNFPGFVYLVALDDAAVKAALTDSHGAVSDTAQAQRYLEKFIQYQIMVPQLTEIQVISLVSKAVEKSIKDTKFEIDFNDYSYLQFQNVWLDFPVTIRMIQKFTAQFQVSLQLLNDIECDVFDVLGLALLQTAFPLVYRRVPAFKRELTSVKLGREELQNLEESMLDGLSGQDRIAAWAALGTLFSPIARMPFTRMRDVSVRDYSSFDRYFAYVVGADDFSEAEIHTALIQAGFGDAVELERLFFRANEAKVETVLFRRISRCLSGISSSTIREVLSALVRLTVSEFKDFYWVKLAEILYDEFFKGENVLSVDQMYSVLTAADNQDFAFLVQGILGRQLDSGFLHEKEAELSALNSRIVRLSMNWLVEDAKDSQAPLDCKWRPAACEAIAESKEVLDRSEVTKAIKNQEVSIEDFASRFVLSELIVNEDGYALILNRNALEKCLPDGFELAQVTNEAIAPAEFSEDSWEARTKTAMQHVIRKFS